MRTGLSTNVKIFTFFTVFRKMADKIIIKAVDGYFALLGIENKTCLKRRRHRKKRGIIIDLIPFRYCDQRVSGLVLRFINQMFKSFIIANPWTRF